MNMMDHRYRSYVKLCSSEELVTRSIHTLAKPDATSSLDFLCTSPDTDMVFGEMFPDHFHTWIEKEVKLLIMDENNDSVKIECNATTGGNITSTTVGSDDTVSNNINNHIITTSNGNITSNNSNTVATNINSATSLEGMMLAGCRITTKCSKQKKRMKPVLMTERTTNNKIVVVGNINSVIDDGHSGDSLTGHGGSDIRQELKSMNLVNTTINSTANCAKSRSKYTTAAITTTALATITASNTTTTTIGSVNNNSTSSTSSTMIHTVNDSVDSGCGNDDASCFKTNSGAGNMSNDDADTITTIVYPTPSDHSDTITTIITDTSSKMILSSNPSYNDRPSVIDPTSDDSHPINIHLSEPQSYDIPTGYTQPIIDSISPIRYRKIVMKDDEDIIKRVGRIYVTLLLHQHMSIINLVKILQVIATLRIKDKRSDTIINNNNDDCTGGHVDDWIESNNNRGGSKEVDSDHGHDANNQFDVSTTNCSTIEHNSQALYNNNNNNNNSNNNNNNNNNSRQSTINHLFTHITHLRFFLSTILPSTLHLLISMGPIITHTLLQSTTITTWVPDIMHIIRSKIDDYQSMPTNISSITTMTNLTSYSYHGRYDLNSSDLHFKLPESFLKPFREEIDSKNEYKTPVTVITIILITILIIFILLINTTISLPSSLPFSSSLGGSGWIY